MAPFIKYLQRLSPTILLCLFLVQCSNNSGPEHIRILEQTPQHIQEVENLSVFPGDSEPSYSIELIPEQTHGETGEPYLSHIQGCDVDNEGRVIIWDIDMDGGGFPPRNRLYVYNPYGTYYTPIGRTGRGPGEFGMLVTMHATAGSVFALDHTNKRMNVYNMNDYSFERSTVVEQWSVRNHEAVQDLGFANLYTRNDGNHIAKFIERVSDTSRPVFKYLLIDTDGDALNFVIPGLPFDQTANNTAGTLCTIAIYRKHNYSPVR